MKIVVTGTSGFIGPRLASRLLDRGHKVYGFERYVTGRTFYSKDNRLNRLFVDLCDHHAVKQQIKLIQPQVVFHLAALSPVAISYEQPQIVNKTNYLATINLAETCMREVDNFKHFIFAGCYDEETEMLTRDGWKSWNKLQTSDLALSINPSTKEIEWKPITKIVKKHYVGKMVHFTGRSIDLLVTPNHNMLIETKGNKTNKIIFEDALKTAKRSICWLLNGAWIPQIFSRQIIGGIPAEDFFYLAGFYIAEGNSDIQVTKFTPKTMLTHAQYISTCRDNSGRFVVISQTNNKEKCSESARVFFNNQQERLKLKVHELLIKNNIPAKIEKNCVFSSSKTLFTLFDELGHSALTKHIPRWMLESNTSCLLQLYHGLMDGDGTKRGRSFSTASKQLMENFVELCIKLGFGATVGTRYNRTNKLDTRTISSPHPQYTIYIQKTKNGLYKNNNHLVDYSGIIWCPVVEDNHTLLVKRNGRVAWCGNTSEEYGNQEHFPIREAAPYFPNSPYAVSKVAANLYLDFMRDAYGFPVTVCRPFNTYGRIGTTHFVVERIISQILGGCKELNLGDPLPVRDLLFRTDHVNAYLSVFANRKESVGEAFNFCTGSGVTIEKLVELISKKISFKGRVNWHTIPRRPLDIHTLVGDPTKAQQILKWKANYSLSEGLDLTISELKKQNG